MTDDFWIDERTGAWFTLDKQDSDETGELANG